MKMEEFEKEIDIAAKMKTFNFKVDDEENSSPSSILSIGAIV